MAAWYRGQGGGAPPGRPPPGGGAHGSQLSARALPHVLRGAHGAAQQPAPILGGARPAAGPGGAYYAAAAHASGTTAETHLASGGMMGGVHPAARDYPVPRFPHVAPYGGGAGLAPGARYATGV